MGHAKSARSRFVTLSIWRRLREALCLEAALPVHACLVSRAAAKMRVCGPASPLLSPSQSDRNTERSGRASAVLGESLTCVAIEWSCGVRVGPSSVESLRRALAVAKSCWSSRRRGR